MNLLKNNLTSFRLDAKDSDRATGGANHHVILAAAGVPEVRHAPHLRKQPRLGYLGQLAIRISDTPKLKRSPAPGEEQALLFECLVQVRFEGGGC